MWFDGFTDPCDYSKRYRHHVQRTDHEISADPQLFHHLDGKYHPCDETGYQGVWTFQHQPAAENGHQFPGDGSTSTAKYCLSATAEKDGIELIAAVMAAPDYKARFADAAALLNYGYSICRLYEDHDPPVLPSMPVEGGVEEQIGLVYDGAFSYLSTSGEDFGTIERILKLEETLKAPVEAGQKAGILEYRLQGEKIGEILVVTETAVRQAGYPDYLKRLVLAWLTGL